MFMTIENDDDRDFIAALYDKYYKLCYKRAYAIVQNHAVAEDMINDAFIKLIDKIELLRQMECYKTCTYIVITVENTCKTYMTRSSKHGKQLDYLNDDNMGRLPSDFSSEKAVYDILDRETVCKVIKKLSNVEQTFLIKTYYEKLNDKQIADEMGMQYNAVRVYRNRLIKKIGRLCSKESEGKIYE